MLVTALSGPGLSPLCQALAKSDVPGAVELDFEEQQLPHWCE